MTHGISEVVERGMCVGCGSCAVRTSGAIPVTIGRLGVYEASLAGATSGQIAIASKVCPFSDDAKNETVLGDERYPDLDHDTRVGRYLDIFAGRVTDDARVLGSSSGGLTSFLLEELLRDGHVDGVVHVGRGENSELFEYVVSTTVEELTSSRKSAYYSTTIADAVSQIRGDGRRYAVVGIPCFIKAFRLIADQMPDLETQFTFYVGLVCGHLKSQFFAESLGWQADVPPDSLARMDFRRKNPNRSSSDYDYEVESHAGERRVRPTSSAVDGKWGYGAFQPEACNFCDDIFAEAADVAFADAWLPEYMDDWRGMNVVVTRDRVVQGIFEAGTARAEIEVERLGVEDAADSQGGNFRHRRVGLAVRLADDIRAGLSVPSKRVEPGYAGVTRRRRALIRQRRAMSRLSLERFDVARRASDISLYIRPMKRAIVQYRVLDALSRGVLSTIRRLLKPLGTKRSV